MTTVAETHTTTHTVGRLGATAIAICESLGLTDEVEFRVGIANGRPAITFDVRADVVTSETERESLLCRLDDEFGPGTSIEIYDCPDGRRLGSVYQFGEITMSAHAKLRPGGAS